MHQQRERLIHDHELVCRENEKLLKKVTCFDGVGGNPLSPPPDLTDSQNSLRAFETEQPMKILNQKVIDTNRTNPPERKQDNTIKPLSSSIPTNDGRRPSIVLGVMDGEPLNQITKPLNYAGGGVGNVGSHRPPAKTTKKPTIVTNLGATNNGLELRGSAAVTNIKPRPARK